MSPEKQAKEQEIKERGYRLDACMYMCFSFKDMERIQQARLFLITFQCLNVQYQIVLDMSPKGM